MLRLAGLPFTIAMENSSPVTADFLVPLVIGMGIVAVSIVWARTPA